MNISEKESLLLDAYYDTNRVGVWIFDEKNELSYGSFPYSTLFFQSHISPLHMVAQEKNHELFFLASDNELYATFHFSENDVIKTVFIGPVFFSRPQIWRDFERLSFCRTFPHGILLEICDAIPVIGLMNFVSLTRFLMLAFTEAAPSRVEMEGQIQSLSTHKQQISPLPDNEQPEEDCLNTYRTEQLFLNHVKHGEIEKVKAVLSGTKKVRSGKMSDDTATQRLFDMICSTTLVTRTALQGGLNPTTAFSLSDFYIQKASRITQPSELTMLSHQMLLDFTRRMAALRKQQDIYSLPVQKTMDYVSLHFHEKITVGQLAKHAHVSASHLSRIFKKETNTSIQNFIRDVRVNEAKELLLTTDYTFSTISSMLSFSSQSYFISVFKAQTGRTPGEYRRRHGK